MFFQKSKNRARSNHRLYRLLVGTLTVATLLCSLHVSSRAASKNRLYDQTVEAFEQVSCLTPEQFNYHKGLIKTLGYTNLNVFKAFCSLPTIFADKAITVLKRLAVTRIKYDHVAIFENFIYQDDITMEDGWQLLVLLNNLKYAPSRALMGLSHVSSLSLDDMEKIIDQIQSLDEAGHWAAKSFLLLPGHTATTINRGLTILHSMDEHQRWAVESLCLIKDTTIRQVFESMAFISILADSDAGNVRQLFKLARMTPTSASSWLTSYFNLALWDEESHYFSLSRQDKSTLLEAFNNGSDYLIWKINNLHDVTDRYGQEIGNYRLSISSLARLSQLFNQLAPSVRRRFGKQWQKGLDTGKKTVLINTLRRATTVARSQAAKDLTSANCYILLSRGSELYDSSFRNILVPVLKKRIMNTFSDNLLRFLLAVDPNNNHISDFIISLAQKGKLTTFFPKDAAEQEKVLDLVAESAFQDENSLILFSATFTKLLQAVQPETRGYLIDKMLRSIENNNTVFTTQLRVILQYYLHEHPNLLAHKDKNAITRMIADNGFINLSKFTTTAFHEWKKDGKLQSLSIFQTDDDGRKSFFSNCRTLLGKGYKPRVSNSYSLLPAGSSLLATSHRITGSLRAQPTNGLAKLYRLMARHPIVIDWVKWVNNIEISHSVFIYQGETIQQRLLEQFIKKGHEMFAQRGHSYWRKEQLLDPITKLIQSGSINDQDLLAKQRFMTIGSCGGIRAYSELNYLFKNNVDILATVGTGKSIINNPYNHKFFEVIATSPDTISWKEVAAQTFHIFKQGMGEEYLQPGCLPAILHKIMDMKQLKKKK